MVGDAATFAADIRAVLDGGVPTHAGRIRHQAAAALGVTATSTLASTSRPVPRLISWWAIAGLSAVTLILGILLSHAFLSKPDATQQREVARARTVTLPRTAANGIIPGSWAQRLRANPKTVVISAVMTTADRPGIAWSSFDGGDTWTTIASPWPVAKSTSMDPTGLASRSVVLTDSGVLVAVRLQVDAANNTAPAQIWRSSNIGRTWSREAKTVANFHTILPVDEGALLLYRDGEFFDGIKVSRDLGRTHTFLGAKVSVTDSSPVIIFSHSPATWARLTGGAVLVDERSAVPFATLGLDGKVRRRVATDGLLRDPNGQLRIESLAINPLDEREWYAAARGLGLLRSSDAGVTWTGFTLNKNVSVVACAGGKSRATLLATGNDTVVIELGGAPGGEDLFPLTLAATAARPAGQSR